MEVLESTETIQNREQKYGTVSNFDTCSFKVYEHTPEMDMWTSKRQCNHRHAKG